ncbi:MAG TPA: hypothetical protein VFB38_17380 [Chthonomonadaceae bacterium]|nr:hypothetical protein [Chthonomonadaceae bacterium]
MHRLFRSALALFALLAFAPTASAQLVIEFPFVDAGDLPETALMTRGPGPLSRIIGRISSPADIDLFCINIINPAIFMATTVDTFGTLDDTQLFLFNQDGTGVVANDDAPDDALRSTIPAGFVTTPGRYFLGISAFDADPLGRVNPADPNSELGFIFENTKFGAAVQRPIGPAGGDRVRAWSQTGFDFGFYTIDLTGTRVCVVAVPESGRVALFAAGSLVLLGFALRHTRAKGMKPA